MKKKASIIAALPAIVLYTLFILVGQGDVLVESFGYIPTLGFDHVSPKAYTVLFKEGQLLRQLAYSLWIACFSSMSSLIIGGGLAFATVRSKRKSIRTFRLLMGRMGMVLPYLYMVFLLMLFLSKTGLVARFSYLLGWIEGPQDFPDLLYHRSGFGIIVAFVMKGTAFSYVFLLQIFDYISSEYQDVARTLGASGRRILRRIYCPLAKSNIIWVTAILFAYNLGSFEVPYLLANSRIRVLSSVLYSNYMNPLPESIPLAMATSIVLMMSGLIFGGIYIGLINWWIEKGGKV